MLVDHILGTRGKRMRLSWQATGWSLFGATAVFSVLFLALPQIDLWASALFFDEANGFWLRRNPIFEFIRFFLIDGLTLLAVLVFGMLIRSALIGRRRAVPINVWGFMTASFLLAPILLVNGILKAYWGRARPANVEFFGGEATFTPPLLITDQCTSNCSFVSGEGSAIATTVIVLAIVLWPNLKGFWRGFSLWFVLPFSVFGIALRIITGRHFLSDTIFAILFCGVVIWALYRAFNMDEHRHALTFTAFRKDLSKKGL